MANSVNVNSTMTTTKINKVLKENRNVIFKAGTYKLTACLKVYSNSNITCEPGVIFQRQHKSRMLIFDVSTDTTKYNGTHDCKWIGGKFIPNTNSTNANVIVIFHCKNITLSNIVIDGCVGLHSLEINASENVTVENCTFMNQSAKPDGKFREAIQLDFAYKAGLTISGATESSKCYDETYTKNITIKNCKFNNVPNGIGTHTVGVKELYHTDITISNCTFEKIGTYGIKLVGFKNVKINKCNTKLYINKLSTAHKLAGGKISIPERGNINVTVDDIIIK